MAKYHISWLENKTSTTGKAFKKMSLIDESNVQHDNVSIWADDIQFSKAALEGDIEGEIVPKGNFKNFKGSGGNLSGRGYTNPAKNNSIAKFQEVKREDIKVAMDRKEDSFKTSATFRDATLLTVEYTKSNNLTNPEVIKVVWLEWRKWLLENYDIPPF